MTTPIAAPKKIPISGAIFVYSLNLLACASVFSFGELHLGLLRLIQRIGYERVG